jgi:hypothetical protein
MSRLALCCSHGGLGLARRNNLLAIAVKEFASVKTSGIRCLALQPMAIEFDPEQLAWLARYVIYGVNRATSGHGRVKLAYKSALVGAAAGIN